MLIPCESALIPEPIVVDAAGNFSATGVIIRDSWLPMVGSVEHIAGSVVGRKLSLTLTIESPEVPPSVVVPLPFTLLSGQHVRWGYYECTE